MSVFVLRWTSLVLFLWSSLTSLSRGELISLFGVDPVGNLWRTRVNLTGNGTISSKQYITIPDVIVQNVNFDPDNYNILLDTIGHRNVISGSVCNKQFSSVGGYGLNESQNVGAFASYQGVFYFLLIYSRKRSTRKIIELRSTKGCENYISFQHNNISDIKMLPPNLIKECSTKIAQIDFTRDSHVFFRPGSNMKIKSDEGNLSFIFSFIKYAEQTGNRYIARSYVYHVTDAGHVSILDETEIPGRFIQWDVRAIMSVDWLENHICWSSLDKIKCGLLDGNKLSDVKMIVNPGEGVIHRICTGTEHKGLALITGVAMAISDDTICVFFGCYAQHNTTGGVGMVTYTPKWTDRKLQKLSMTNGYIYGGSLVVVNDSHIDVTPKCQYDNGYIYLPDKASSNNVPRIQTQVSHYIRCLLFVSYYLCTRNL